MCLHDTFNGHWGIHMNINFTSFTMSFCLNYHTHPHTSSEVKTATFCINPPYTMLTNQTTHTSHQNIIKPKMDTSIYSIQHHDIQRKFCKEVFIIKHISKLNCCIEQTLENDLMDPCRFEERNWSYSMWSLVKLHQPGHSILHVPLLEVYRQLLCWFSRQVDWRLQLMSLTQACTGNNRQQCYTGVAS